MTLSDHARARCAEMGISTKIVKRIVREPEATWPCREYGHPPGRTFVRAPAVDPRLLLVVDLDQHVVVTVLWWAEDQYTDRRFYTA